MRFDQQIDSSLHKDLASKILHFFSDEKDVLFLDSNSSSQAQYDWILAVGAVDEIKQVSGNSFEAFQAFYDKHRDWIFGSFSYDLKNELEALASNNADGIEWAPIHFFLAKYLFIAQGGMVKAYAHESQEPFDFSLLEEEIQEQGNTFEGKIKARIAKEDYLNNVDHIKWHIQRGDIYEMNYCQEFYAEGVSLNPLHTFHDLNKLSKAPFTSFYKADDKYLLSASPERYLRKRGTTILSQPIKGTRKRGANKEEDELLKAELLADQKERSENVMIVDLVRSDLSKIAQKSTVEVEELFGIYTFDQVHQMISTVKCELKADKKLKDIFEATFPMGSMTGAPKIRAMELIEEFETTKRGLYSGAVGYVNPQGDFDFNVVIRSILYNAKNKYLSFMVGGAITIASEAEKEYQECMVKAKALFKVLERKHAEQL